MYRIQKNVHVVIMKVDTFISDDMRKAVVDSIIFYVIEKLNIITRSKIVRYIISSSEIKIYF